MERIVAVKEWSVALRINHWATALSIFALIATGFYIAEPFTIYAGETADKFFMGDVRFIHILVGVILLFLFLWRIYLAFFSRFRADWSDFLSWTDWKCLIEEIKFYLLIRKDSPGHRCIYGPIQSVSYTFLMIMVLLMVVTGLILMGAGYHAGWTSAAYFILKPVQNLMGGLGTVRYIHHVFTWFFVLFIVVHVYMAFWYDAVLKQGTISSMIGGRLFERIEE